MKTIQVKVTQEINGKSYHKVKLVLVKVTKVPDGNVYLEGIGYKAYLISQTEWCNTVGDSALNAASLEVIPCDENTDNHVNDKIVAMPENFSLEILQKIADGIIKNNDDIFVECREFLHHETGKTSIPFMGINLKEKNHISIIAAISNMCKDGCHCSINKFGKIRECHENGCVMHRIETQPFMLV